MNTRQSTQNVTPGVLLALVLAGLVFSGCATRPTEPSEETSDVPTIVGDCSNFTLTMLERSSQTSRGTTDYAAVEVTRLGQFKGKVTLSVVESSAPTLFSAWKFDPNPSDGISAWEFKIANDPSLRGTQHDVTVRGDDANTASSSWCTVSHPIIVVNQ